jgi:hypothetical protein
LFLGAGLVLVAVLTAGCVGDGAPVEQAGDPSRSADNETARFASTLASMPDDAEWVLYEVDLPRASDLTVEIVQDYIFPSRIEGEAPDAFCSVRWAGEYAEAFLRTHGSRIEVAGGGWQTQAKLSGTTSGYRAVQTLRLLDQPADQRVPVLLGLDQRNAWQDAGAEVGLTVSAEEPFEVRRVDSGEVHCTTGGSAFEAGTFSRAGPAWTARGLLESYRFSEAGYLVPLISTAGSYEVCVGDPTGVHWSEAWSQTDDEEAEAHQVVRQLFELDASQRWRLSFPSAHGPGGPVGAVALDVPAWAHELPRSSIHGSLGEPQPGQPTC